MSLVGAVYGTLLVNAGKTFFSESFPDMWLFLMAALFIGVTMAFPLGLAGLWESRIAPWWRERQAALKAASAAAKRPTVPAAVPREAVANPPAGAAGSLPKGAVTGQNA